MMQERLSDLSINQVSGSIFSGNAAQLVYQGLDLGPVQWRFRPLALLFGSLEYRIKLTAQENAGQLTAGKSILGRSYVKDMDITLLPGRLINHYSPVAVETSGAMRLVFEELNSGEDYSGVSGRINWQDAAVLEPVNLVLGPLEIDISTRDGLLVGSFDNSGNLGVSGELTLSALNEYRIDLTLRPAGDINTETLELLEQYAIRQSGGEFRIDKSGQF